MISGHDEHSGLEPYRPAEGPRDLGQGDAGDLQQAWRIVGLWLGVQLGLQAVAGLILQSEKVQEISKSRLSQISGLTEMNTLISWVGVYSAKKSLFFLDPKSWKFLALNFHHKWWKMPISSWISANLGNFKQKKPNLRVFQSKFLILPRL